MAQLSRPIDLTRRDIPDAHHSAEKIATRFHPLEDPQPLDPPSRETRPDEKES